MAKDLRLEVNKSIAADVRKLLEQEEFRRFFYWLITETGVLVMPDCQEENPSFGAGRRQVGFGLIACLESYRWLDTCRADYLARMAEIQKTLKERG